MSARGISIDFVLPFETAIWFVVGLQERDEKR